MSKIMNEERQKAIQEAEKIIAEARRKDLEGGALIVLRVSPVDTDALSMVIQGDPTSAISALGAPPIPCNSFVIKKSGGEERERG